MQMLKPIEESSDNKTLVRIEQVKVQMMNADYWRAKWCIRIRRGLLGTVSAPL